MSKQIIIQDYLFSETLKNVHYTNLKTNLYYQDEKKLHANPYCTWGFFTREEIDTDLWVGDEVFSRKEGILYFPKFQCRAGRRQVIRFIRDIQQFMWDNHPEIATAEGLRLYPDGSRRDEKWHRKVA